MRRRTIDPEFWTDERVVAVSDGAKLLFQGLWAVADREGRLEEKPMAIGFKVRPWAPMEVAGLLTELVEAGLVVRYATDGRKLLLVPNLAKHQYFHKNEAKSDLPPPPDSGNGWSPSGQKAASTPMIAGDRGRGRGSGTGRSGAGVTTVKSPAAAAPVALVVSEPETPVDRWMGEDFWRWFQCRRQKAGFVAEKPPHPNVLSSWWSTALLTLGGDVEALKKATFAFGDDKFWQDKDPPLPFDGFKSQCPPKWIPRKERPRAEG